MNSILLLLLAVCAALAVDSNGTNPPDARIIGGTAVPIEQFPWIISLRWRGHHKCGGSIIRPNRILTAAHCMTDPVSEYHIRAGSTLHASGGQLIAVARIINHPQYNPNARPTDFDVSVLWLASSLNMVPVGVAIVPMAPQGAGVASGAAVSVAGWGFTSNVGPSPANLQSAALSVVANAQCTQNNGVQISASMVCAGYAPGGRGICHTDSGGPLTLNGQLVGVVSFGAGCALANRPGVFARVSFFRNWIEANL